MGQVKEFQLYPPHEEQGHELYLPKGSSILSASHGTHANYIKLFILIPTKETSLRAKVVKVVMSFEEIDEREFIFAATLHTYGTPYHVFESKEGIF